MLYPPTRIVSGMVTDPHKKENNSSVCGVCYGTAEASTEISKVVSPNFTDWGELSSSWMCDNCVKILVDKQYRTRITYVKDSTWLFLTPAQAIAVFTKGPLAYNEALNIPLTGRKHTLLYTRWGKVSTDTGAYSWGEKEGRMLHGIMSLKTWGYSRADVSSSIFMPRMLTTVAEEDTEFFLSIVQERNSWFHHPLYPMLLKIVYAPLQEQSTQTCNGTDTFFE